MDGRTERPYTEYHSDPDAKYAKVYEIKASDIPPTVAFPHLPSNTRPVAEARDVKIDQSVSARPRLSSRVARFTPTCAAS